MGAAAPNHTRDGASQGLQEVDIATPLHGTVRDAVVVTDPEGVITSWDAAAATLTGLTAADAVGRRLDDLAPEDDRAAGLLPRLRATTAETGRVDHDGWWPHTDGRLFPCSLIMRAVPSALEPQAYAVVLHDRSLDQGASEALQLVDQVLDYAIIALDASGHVASWNAGAERLKGYAADEIIGHSFQVFYPAADREDGLPARLLDTARRDGRVEHQGWRLRRDGTPFWGDVVITAVHDDAGTLAGFAKVTRDLTEQRALQLDLQASEQRYRGIIETLRDYAIVALDAEGRVRSWNAGGVSVFGYQPAEIVGADLATLLDPADTLTRLDRRLLDEARDTGRVALSCNLRRADGEQFWGEVVLTRIEDAVGGYGLQVRDQSESKRLDRMRESVFAAFEHDIRAPLAAIRGYASLLREEADGLTDDFLGRIESNADTLLHLANNITEFARLRSGGLVLREERIELARLAQTIAHDLGPEYGQGRVALVGEPTVVLADRLAVRRVLVNIVSNALKYSSPGSRVDVGWGVLGELVRVQVTDRGRGIAPEDIASIFEEFERGRLAQDDGGTGLGLASAKRLVQGMGGTIHLDSELGRGTTMTFTLPLAGPES